MKEAVDSGRKAALEARGDLEMKLEKSKAAYRAGIDAAREATALSAAAKDDGAAEEEAEE